MAPASRGGFVTRVSTLTTSAFALHAARALAGPGKLRLSVSQPLRVERGRAWLSLPAGRTGAGRGVSQPGAGRPGAQRPAVGTSPGSGAGPLAGGELRLGAVLSLRPGHRQAHGPGVDVPSAAGVWSFDSWRRDLPAQFGMAASPTLAEMACMFFGAWTCQLATRCGLLWRFRSWQGRWRRVFRSPLRCVRPFCVLLLLGSIAQTVVARMFEQGFIAATGILHAGCVECPDTEARSKGIEHQRRAKWCRDWPDRANP